MNGSTDKIIMTESNSWFWDKNINLPDLSNTIVTITVDSVQREFFSFLF